MKNKQTYKSPGNDGLTKEFYGGFWDEMKELLISSATEAKHRGELSISQRQAIIKLIEKKDRDKRYIKNWRSISLLNVDTKIISKALLEMLKNVLSSLISMQQTAYIKNRSIEKGGRLIPDIVNICDCNNIGGFLVTIDIEKAFDSLDHKFILAVLKKFGFGKNFVPWVEPLLNNQEFWVINGGITTRYFPLQQGVRQGDPLTAYVFILCFFEILFILIKNDPNIKGIENLEYCYLYTTYADYTTSFLKYENSIAHLSEKVKLFSDFSGLKPNTTRCEVAGIGVLNGVQVAVCGMKCTDLINETIKVLGAYFSYNQKIKDDKNFYNISNIQGVLNLWRMINLTLDILVIFKTFAILKIVFLALLTKIPHKLSKSWRKYKNLLFGKTLLRK